MADERGGDAAGYLGWFFLGAVAGAAAALLLAPKSGKLLRKDLKKGYDDALDTASDWAEKARAAYAPSRLRRGWPMSCVSSPRDTYTRS